MSVTVNPKQEEEPVRNSNPQIQTIYCEELFNQATAKKLQDAFGTTVYGFGVRVTSPGRKIHLGRVTK